MEIQRVLRQFITTNFYPGESFVFTPDASLIDSGLIDSTGVLELITFLESEFAITNCEVLLERPAEPAGSVR